LFSVHCSGAAPEPSTNRVVTRAQLLLQSFPDLGDARGSVSFDVDFTPVTQPC